MWSGSRLVLAAVLVATASCGSESSSNGGDHGGGNAGAGNGNGGSGGSSNGGTAMGGTAMGGTAMGGSATGGNSGSATGGGSGVSGGGQSGAGGMSGAAGASAGRSGGGGSNGGMGGATCAEDDDCVVAKTYSSAGCCSRGCGVALNGEWVANEPCATADPMTDPVPSSCSTGCAQCPQDPRCQEVFEAVCLSGTCKAVTAIGPCTVDEDCVLAVDYESQFGGCCSCPTVASRTTLEHAPCIVPVSDPKPQGCEPSPANACDLTTCPATCATPMNLRCSAGSCISG